jgi:heme-degrading monooxygenase HmoA
MAVLMENHVEQSNAEIYDAVAAKLDVEADTPEGMVVHTAIDLGDRGIRIVDVWESQQAFEAFRDSRLLPAIEAVLSERGIEPMGPPNYEFSEIHHLVTP